MEAGYAQNPFAVYGYHPKMATLSNGRFDEYHDKDRIVEIGTVKFDTKTDKIVGLVEPDTLNSAMDVKRAADSYQLTPMRKDIILSVRMPTAIIIL